MHLEFLSRSNILEESLEFASVNKSNDYEFLELNILNQ